MASHVLYKQLLLGLSELMLRYFQLESPIETGHVSSQNIPPIMNLEKQYGFPLYDMMYVFGCCH